MATQHRGNGVVVSIWGAAGVFLLGFFGAEALFGPGAEGLPLEATLIPSLLAAAAAFLYLMTQPLGGAEADEEDAPTRSPLVVPRVGPPRRAL
jgi:hypothetical protein